MDDPKHEQENSARKFPGPPPAENKMPPPQTVPQLSRGAIGPAKNETVVNPKAAAEKAAEAKMKADLEPARKMAEDLRKSPRYQAIQEKAAQTTAQAREQEKRIEAAQKKEAEATKATQKFSTEQTSRQVRKLPNPTEFEQRKHHL